MKFNIIREATREWVNSFYAIPQSLIEKAYGYWGDITEITPPGLGDRVYVYDEEKEAKLYIEPRIIHSL